MRRPVRAYRPLHKRMSGSILKLVFLIGRSDAGTTRLIARVCQLANVEVAAVLLDTGVSPTQQRWRNLKRNVRRQGVSYIFHRAMYALREKLEHYADQVIPQRQVRELLDRAFPEDNLDNLSRKFGFPVIEAGNLNSDKAIESLRSLQADLGVVLGTRILKRSLFSVPRLGCINLHKGRVPEYRGMPPGFWELYDGCSSAGVTVHFVDDGLDTGSVVAIGSVPIHARETPESLRSKLDQEGCAVLLQAITQIADGTASPWKQPGGNHKPHTKPTRAQKLDLAKRLPHWRTLSDGRQAVKTAAYLLVFWSGFYSLVRRLRKNKSRGAILLYHRVNDISQDPLTASTRRFAEHLVTLRQYYRYISTEDLVERIATGKPIEATSVAIHFDDCYRDVRTCAAPLLAAAGSPGVAFVSSGFVDTSRIFIHDQNRSPHRFENFRLSDLVELPALGVSVGAHTVNHVDLGSVSLEQAKVEVEESRRDLEQMTGRPVLLFSFPFGRLDNIREEVRQMVIRAGYRALFSAHGGFVDRQTSLFDIPRFGISSIHSPLALMMELEGISFAHLSYWLKQKLRRSQRPVVARGAALDPS